MAKADSLSTLEEAVKNNDGNRIKELLSGSDLVHLAVSCNSGDALTALLVSGCSANGLNKEFKRPVEIAILTSRLDLIGTLLKHGGTLDFVTKNGDTVLHTIARIGSPESAEYCLKINQEMVDKRNNFGETPLHVASSADNSEVVKVLIYFNANINAKDNNDRTPLHVATGNSLKVLLTTEADVNMEDKDGNTPLEHAVFRGSLEDTKSIVASNKADIENYKKPLMIAVALSRADIVELLIMTGGDFHNITLLLKGAIDKGHVETLQTLLVNGIDTNIEFEEITPFHEGIRKCTLISPLEYAQKNKLKPEIIKLLEQYTKKEELPC